MTARALRSRARTRASRLRGLRARRAALLRPRARARSTIAANLIALALHGALRPERRRQELRPQRRRRAQAARRSPRTRGCRLQRFLGRRSGARLVLAVAKRLGVAAGRRAPLADGLAEAAAAPAVTLPDPRPVRGALRLPRRPRASRAALAEVVRAPRPAGQRVARHAGGRARRLDVFKGRFRTSSRNYLSARAPRPGGGPAAISGRSPVQRERAQTGRGVEPELVDAVLDEVASRRVDLGAPSRGAPRRRHAADRGALSPAGDAGALGGGARRGSDVLRLERSSPRARGSDRRAHLDDAMASLSPRASACRRADVQPPGDAVRDEDRARRG